MATFTMRHEIDCTPEKFWELFFDTELQKTIFSELQFPKWEVVEQKETETEIVRIVKAIPKLDAPAAVTKVLGSGFGYTEEGRFDKASKVYRFVVKPTALADKLRNEGTVRCEPNGADKCTRIVEVIAEAKVFGIGGMIEKMTEKGTREGWEKGAQLFNARLKSGG
jgi:capsid portal protein